MILGCGYVGLRLARRLTQAGVRVAATTRDAVRAERLRAVGIAVAAQGPEALAPGVLADCEAVIDSIPLERTAQGWRAPQLRWVDRLVASMPRLRWAGYLSSTGVYGDAAGGWVDEASTNLAVDGRGAARLEAERAWRGSGAPVELFRISGIYGPGRNLIERLRRGGYVAVAWDPPRYANRIHVDDLVEGVVAAIARPRPGRVVNLTDDLPSPHADYVRALARAAGAPDPLVLAPEEARRRLSPDYLAFFRANRRVSNRLLHRELLPRLRYPSFRAALPSLLAGGA